MKNSVFLTIATATSFCIGFFFREAVRSTEGDNRDTYPGHIAAAEVQTASIFNTELTPNMKLGAFSVSLSVKDINASKAFYENLGFTVFGGSLARKYLIMKNETTLIGIFQGMFEGNMLTFNPGWDDNARNIEKFEDIREIQKQLKSKGITLNPEADEKTSGPASFMLKDPDGNLLLFDQHR